MSGPGKTRRPGPLTEAASALEEELAKVESAIDEVGIMPLTSERRIRRAAARLAELSDLEERLRAPLAALGAAMAALVERQKAAGAQLEARATEIASRRAALADLFGRYEALGREAGDVRRGLEAEGAGQDLGAVAGRLRSLADEAEGLSRDGFGGGFPEFAQEAHGLRQQLLALCNRLALASSVPPPTAAG